MKAKPLIGATVRAKSRSVETLILSLASAAVAAIPAGFAAALASRRLAGTPQPPIWLAVLCCVAIALWAGLVMPSAALLAISCALGWTLFALSTVDALALRLPDVLTYPLIAAGLIASWFLPARDLSGHAIGAVAGFAVFYAIAEFFRRARGKEGLGLGDAKLAAAAGAWLGWQALSFVILVACAAGFAWFGIAMLRRGRSALEERMPFGIALAFAIWIVWLYGLPSVLDPIG